MNVSFDPLKHTYTVDGVRYPSVSEILSSVGIGFGKRRVIPEAAQAAMDFGTAVHAGTALIDTGGDPDPATVSDDAGVQARFAAHMKQYRRFVRETGWGSLQIENPLAFGVPGVGYAGTPDRLGHLRSGKSCILEIKTGEYHWWYQVQAAAYATLAFYQPGYEGLPFQARILMLRIDDYEIIEGLHPGAPTQIFDLACQLYHAKKRMGAAPDAEAPTTPAACQPPSAAGTSNTMAILEPHQPAKASGVLQPKLRIVMDLEVISEANQCPMTKLGIILAKKRKQGQRQAVYGRMLLDNVPKEPPPRFVCFTRHLGHHQRPFDPDDNLPSAFKAIKDEIAKWFAVNDGVHCPIDWLYTQVRSDDGMPRIAIEMEW